MSLPTVNVHNTLTIVNIEKVVWKLTKITIELIIYVGQGLCKNKVLHRHVCIVFLPSPPIAIPELPNCSSHEWLTFLKRCYWLVRQEYNKHVTMKSSFLHKPEQKHR